MDTPGTPESASILIIGYVWPEPTSSAAGVRDWDLLRTFLDAGWKVSFTSPSKENEFSRKIQEAGVDVRTLMPNDPSFDSFVAGLKPDFVLFDRFVTEEQFGWRVREQSPGSMRIVDTQDLHFLRRARQRAHEAGLPLELISEDTHRELASIYRSDLSLLVSTDEMELLTGKLGVPRSLLEWVPIRYDEPRTDPLPFEARANFSFIGNFRHPPNADAVLWLKREIWPLIRAELPGAELHVYGAYPPKEMMSLTSASTGFIVRGPTENQYDTLERYRINLAPLRFGAGVKGKITDGWWSGTPVVSTGIGAEGLTFGEAESWGGLISRQTAKDFAENAVALYHDPSAWTAAQERGISLMRRHLSRERHASAWLSRLLAARSELEARRAENLIGGMLWHHLHKSTTYFSRWIELKNSISPATAKDSQSQA